MHECIRTEESNKSSTGLLDRETEFSSLWADFLSESKRNLEETQKDLENAKSKLQDTKKNLHERKNELRTQTGLFQDLQSLDGLRLFFLPGMREFCFRPCRRESRRGDGRQAASHFHSQS